MKTCENIKFISNNNFSNNKEGYYYKVALVNNFDPCTGELPADGDKHIIADSVFDTKMLAVNCDTISDKYFSFAVRKYSSNGFSGNWYYSNILHHNDFVQGDFTLEHCTASDPDTGRYLLELKGHDCGGNKYYYIQKSDNNIFHFDSIVKGTYDICAIHQYGFRKDIENANFDNDHNDTITMELIKPVPYNIAFDTLSLKLTWDTAMHVLLYEDFESDTFPPQNWKSFRWDIAKDSTWTSRYAFNNRYFWQKTGEAKSYYCQTCGYLELPLLDLRDADNYIINLDNRSKDYCNNYIDYTFDTNTNNNYHFLSHMNFNYGKWINDTFDLSRFSGFDGAGYIKLAFHNRYIDWYISFDVDNVKIYSTAPLLPDNYLIFLDDSLVKISPIGEDSVQLGWLDYESHHQIKICAAYPCGNSDTIIHSFTSYYLPAPDSIWDNYSFGTDSLTLFWSPPLDNHGEIAKGLISFILSKPDNEIDTIPYIEGINTYSYSDTGLLPHPQHYGVKALYDMSAYGHNGVFMLITVKKYHFKNIGIPVPLILTGGYLHQIGPLKA